MGHKRVETLDDAWRHGYVLEITCLRCRRMRYVAPACLCHPRRDDAPRLRSNVRIDRLGRMLVCRGTADAGLGCQGKGARVRALPEDFLPPTPPGIHRITWLNAGTRERRRLEHVAAGEKGPT